MIAAHLSPISALEPHLPKYSRRQDAPTLDELGIQLDTTESLFPWEKGSQDFKSDGVAQFSATLTRI